MPVFLTLDDVMELHAEQIAAYGGSDGLQSADLLKSAIAQPEATFGGQFLHSDRVEFGTSRRSTAWHESRECRTNARRPCGRPPNKKSRSSE